MEETWASEGSSSSPEDESSAVGKEEDGDGLTEEAGWEATAG